MLDMHQAEASRAMRAVSAEVLVKLAITGEILAEDFKPVPASGVIEHG